VRERRSAPRPAICCAFRNARAAAAALSAQARPDLHAPLQVYAERLNRARFAELMAAPTAGAATLLAELEHLRRIVALADTLDIQIARTCLPAGGVPAAQELTTDNTDRTSPRPGAA
jgi:hypothetical protein